MKADPTARAAPVTAGARFTLFSGFGALIFAVLAVLSARTLAGDLHGAHLRGLAPAVALDTPAPRLAADDAPAIALARAAAALSLEPPSWNAARAAVEMRIAEEPRDAAAWARLSFIIQHQDGAVSAEAVEAMRQSMALSGYSDPPLMLWRLGAVLAAWPLWPADVQDAAIAHLQALRLNHENHPMLRQLLAVYPVPRARAAMDGRDQPDAAP